MNEQLLVDLLEGIDVSLLNERFMEEDVELNRGLVLSRFYQEKTKYGIGKKIEKKINRLIGIISGIVATVVLIASVALIIIRKKSEKFAVF